MTYARARLWTGVSGVGLLVLLSVVILVSDAPSLLLDERGGNLVGDAGVILLVLASLALVQLPLDLLGGFVLPAMFRRPHPTSLRFFVRWTRGVALYLSIMCVGATSLVAAGRAGGRPAAFAVLIFILVALVALQEPIARLIGGLRRVEPRSGAGGELGDVSWLEGDDPSFSGGFAGVGRRRLVLPSWWARELRPEELQQLVDRRRSLARSGLRGRGLVAAALWNFVGFVACSFLPNAGVSTVSELFTTAAGFTLWSFAGLLLLPTFSRWATFAADFAVARGPADGERLARTIRVLDRHQDDEPRRGPWVETVFHPVPCAEERERRLVGASSADDGPPRLGGWHLARTALYLSMGSLGLLGRAVHCNAGRPELWVYLPADG